MSFRTVRCLAPFVLSTILLIIPASPAQAQLPFSLDVPLDGVDGYDAAVPTPDSVLGHRIGSRHTEPHQVVAYFRAVAEASDRVVVRTHAKSYEGRPLIHAIVTLPERQAALEDVRQQNLRLSEEPGSVSDADVDAMPAVVYAGYSIHGNEASGTEASMLLLYHLAAGEGSAVSDVLEHAVVLIDPMLNPDGRGRFTTWVNRNRGAVPVADPADREHDEPWPGGRTNHYWFDLNRDWLPARHPESRGRLELFHSWRPQLLTDHHEMGSEATFFFQPGIPSRNNPNTPDRTFELTRRLASFHARALDRIGSLYYSEETYDDFYYGKGSTYPDVNGAVGILFEQASSRALEREIHGDTLSYAFTIRNQFVTSLSTLAGAVAIRPELLAHQRDFYADAPAFASGLETSAYVFDTAEAPSRGEALFELLRRHRIQMHLLDRDATLDGRLFAAGEAVIVPVDQPQARLVKSAMERVRSFQDSLFYDVSTWTLPLAFGVPYAEMQTDPAPYMGERLDVFPGAGGQLIGGRSDYAYVIEWGRYFAPRALYKLQNAGVSTRVMTGSGAVTVDGSEITFPRGSIIVPVRSAGMPPSELQTLLDEIAQTDRLRIYAVASGRTDEGPDMGSPRSEVVHPPAAALLTGSGTAAYNAGEVWHLLSERFRIPVSLLDAEEVGASDLDRYDTVVMAGGGYEELDEDVVTGWVRAGGHLIGLMGAAEWIAENGLIELEEKEVDLDTLYRTVPFEDLQQARGAQLIGGAVLEVEIDPTHPIGYGYRDTVPVFRRGTTFYEPPTEPGLSVARYGAEPLMSGYVSEEMLEHAAGSASIVAGSSGSGRVTLFMDNPNFRAFWYGTNGLFLNALFFGPLY